MVERPLRVFLVLLFACWFGAIGVAQGGDPGSSGAAAAGPFADPQEAFAGLTVVAYGDQVVDIFTGVTTLPEGGEIIDRENGITLSAEWIRYQEGEFVEAEAVRVTGEFGVAHAAEVYIDLTQGRLDASGEVRYEREDIGLTAAALRYFPETGIVDFEGPVTGVGAEFEAASAAYDSNSGVLVLAAPYRYQDVLFELSSEREGALLSLTPAAEEGGSVTASSTVAPEVRARLEPYLTMEETAGGAGGADENSQP